MTKADLIKSVAESTGITQAKAELAVRAVFDEMAFALSRGEEISIHAFGGFVVRKTTARTGRNPQTGGSITIPAGKRIKFTPAKALKDAVTKE